MQQTNLKSIFQGTAIYTVGQMLTKAIGFFLIPIYTFYLAPKEFGVIGYVQSIGNVLGTILALGLYGAQTRFIYDYYSDPKKLGEFLFNINFFIIIFSILVCGAFHWIIIWYNPNFSHSNLSMQKFLIIALWTIPIQTLNQLVVTYYLAMKEFMKCALQQLVQVIFMAAFILYFLISLKQGAGGYLLGTLIGNAAFTILFYFGYTKKFRFHFEKQHLKNALAFGIPVTIHLLSANVNNYADRFILEKYVSLDQLGIYNLGYQIGMVMSVLTIAINQSWQPHYCDLMTKKTDNYHKLIENYFHFWLLIMGSATLFGMLWCRELLGLFSAKAYLSATNIIPTVLISYFVLGIYFFISSPIFYYKKTKILPLITGLCAAFNVAANFIFAPRFGIMAAAYVTMATFLLFAVLAYFYVRRIDDFNYLKTKTLVLIGYLFTSLGAINSNSDTLPELIKILLMSSYPLLFFTFFPNIKIQCHNMAAKLMKLSPRF